MDEHASDKHEDDVDVFPGDGAERIPFPGGSHLVHHVLRRVPGDFVRFGGVEVRACAEEEARKGDEDEGEGHVPGRRKPREGLVAEELENDGDVDAYENDAEPYGGNRAYRNGEVLVDNGAHGEKEEGDACAYVGAALDPNLVEHLAKAVQTAPDDEVPTRSVPPTAHNLGGHGVHVRGDELAGIGLEVGVNGDVEEEEAEGDSDPDASGKENGDRAQEGHPEERTDGCVAVTAQGNVQVIAPPTGKADVPTAPEFRGALCLVRAVEVLRQAESHEEGNADGDVRVSGKVCVNLQRVGEEGNQVFKAGEQERRIENAVHEVCREVVAQDNLFGKTVQNPEHGHAESPAGEEILLVELRNELVGTHNRACDELREECEVESEVENVFDGLDFSAIDVDAVTHRLEREERNAHGQNNRIDERMRVEHLVACGSEEVVDVEFYAGEVVEGVEEEVGILVVAQHQKVYEYNEYHQEFLFPFRLCRFNPLADEEVRNDAENKDADVTAARLVVKEKARGEQECVSQQKFAVNQGEYGEHDCEESPEVELRKEQGTVRVERKGAYQVWNNVIEHCLISEMDKG